MNYYGITYIRNPELWYLFNQTEDELILYKKERGYENPETTRLLINPVPEIIKTDIALSLLNIDYSGDLIKEIMNDNNINEINNLLLKYGLIDGIAFLEADNYNDKIVISVYDISHASGIIYDPFGRIVSGTFKKTANGCYYEKRYQLDSNGKIFYGLFTDDPVLIKNYKEKNQPINEMGDNPFDFIPIYPLFLNESSKELNLSRLEGILDSIDEINNLQNNLNKVYNLHATPILATTEDYNQEELNKMFNSEDTDITDTTDSNVGDSKGKIKVFTLAPEGKIQLVEMGGAVPSIMMENLVLEKKDLINKYQELKLTELMEGSAMSGYAVFLKMISLNSLINKIRRQLADVWNTLLKDSEKLFTPEKRYISSYKTESKMILKEIIESNAMDVLNMVISLWNNNLIDLDTAIEQIAVYLKLPDTEKIKQSIKEGNVKELLYPKNVGDSGMNSYNEDLANRTKIANSIDNKQF